MTCWHWPRRAEARCAPPCGRSVRIWRTSSTPSRGRRVTARHFRFMPSSWGPRAGARHSSRGLGSRLTTLSMDYESRETPSLQGFVAWLRTASAAVKRDMEMARDEVRVMTVHGAKGLEAPIVILADTTTLPAGPPHLQPRLLDLPARNAAP